MNNKIALDEGQMLQSEWDDFQQHFLLRSLKDPSRRLGAMFVHWFPDLANYMAEYSNLGTPAGVHHPNDDVILYGMKSNKEAISFILERIEIVKD